MIGLRGAEAARDLAMSRVLSLYRAGRFAAVVDACAAVLADLPDDPEALHLAGVAEDARGDPARAVDLLGRAVAVRPSPSYLSNLGMALGHLGRHAEAVGCYERALRLRPAYPEALNNLGVSLEALRRHADAEQAYRRAVAARPAYSDAWTNLGNALRVLGRHREAADAFQAAAERIADRLIELGNDRASATEASPDAGPDRLATDHPDLFARLGDLLLRLGRADEAETACARVLAAHPDHLAALACLGGALRLLDRLTESEAALRRVIALRPADAAGYNDLALTLARSDRPLEALAVVDLAVALAPGDAEVQHHRATLLLRGGRLAEGWRAYEHRLGLPQAGAGATRSRQPRWTGEEIAGRTILLTAEQGLGDTLHFCRYAPLVAARGARVVLAVQPPLVPLLRSLEGVAEIVGTDGAPPQHDLHCPLLSLPGLSGPDDVPAAIPYLHPDPGAVRRWATRLDVGRPGLRVGVAWAGNPGHVDDRRRSMPLVALAPLWTIPGVRWFGLQCGERAADLRDVPADALPAGGIADLSAGIADFTEQAAALAALDLVIAVDTVTAHLAGALGRPTWLMLMATPDWRWLTRGTETRWYPTMRLFRQPPDRERPRDGDWDPWAPVVADVAAALRERPSVG